MEKPDGYGTWLHLTVNTAPLDWWKANYGSYTLAELNTKLIVQARDRLQNTPSPPKKVGGERKKRRPSTCNRYVSALSSILQCALERWGWIDQNPCRQVRRLQEKNSRTRFLDDQEQEILLEACKVDPILYDVVVLALMTGARQGELCSLKWSDVDLKDAMLTFRHTKNGETRAVPLNPIGLEILKQRFCNRILGREDWVFPAERSMVMLKFPNDLLVFAKTQEWRTLRSMTYVIPLLPDLQKQELQFFKCRKYLVIKVFL